MSSKATKADGRYEALQNRARRLRDVILPRTPPGTDRYGLAARELAAIRWAIRVLDAEWDAALAHVHRAPDADDDPEEDW